MQFFMVQVSILKHKTQCARASEEHVRANFLKPNHKGTARRTQCSSEQSKGQTQRARSSEAQVRANFLKPNHKGTARLYLNHVDLMSPPNLYALPSLFCAAQVDKHRNQETHVHAIKNMCFHTSPFIETMLI